MEVTDPNRGTDGTNNYEDSPEKRAGGAAGTQIGTISAQRGCVR